MAPPNSNIPISMYSLFPTGPNYLRSNVATA